MHLVGESVISNALNEQDEDRNRNLSTLATALHNSRNILGVYKRMVRFQNLTRNLFLTLHGHNVHRQQRQLSKFLMRYQQFASHA